MEFKVNWLIPKFCSVASWLRAKIKFMDISRKNNVDYHDAKHVFSQTEIKMEIYCRLECLSILQWLWDLVRLSIYFLIQTWWAVYKSNKIYLLKVYSSLATHCCIEKWQNRQIRQYGGLAVTGFPIAVVSLFILYLNRNCAFEGIFLSQMRRVNSENLCIQEIQRCVNNLESETEADIL